MTGPPGRRAVVDRIEEGIAVVLVGDEEDEHHLPAAQLPAGAGEGSTLEVRFERGALVVMGLEDGSSAAALQARLDRLRARRSRRFDR